MTKKERVFAALRGEATDRAPFSAYVHSTVHERTVEKFTAFTLDFYRRYDPDYVKVMWDENYDTPVNRQFVFAPQVWSELEEFDPHIGGFGRQLEILKRVKDAVGPDVPVIQTVFSAFHVGYRLAASRIMEDWEKEPELLTQGLTTITVNTNRFAQACLDEAGIDGFFYGAYGCERAWMSEERYEKMIMPQDMKAIGTLRKAPILILHIHAEKEPMFDLLVDYECNAVSWEDRLTGLSIAEARKRTEKCLVAGIDHYGAVSCTPADIVSQGRDAREQAGGRGLILAPGCTFFPGTPPENMLAMKEAAGG